MLYVFRMDVGQMLTFDITLLTDTVSKLQLEIAKETAIAVDKQILLVSGGHSLKPDQKVISYGAGADTNPVFLFSKLAIESQESPLVRSFGVSKVMLQALKEKVNEAINRPAHFDTVVIRTKLSSQMKDQAHKILQFCNNEFKEQHLQYQGWGTVVANLEEIAQAMKKTEATFSKAFATFLPQRKKHIAMLKNFHETLDLLEHIPLITPLKKESEGQEISKKSMDQGVISFVASMVKSPNTLLQWITTQSAGTGIEDLQRKCFEELHMMNEEMFEQCDHQVQELLNLVTSDPHQMKALVGIERRLSELEKRLNEAKKLAKEQADLAYSFIVLQSRLSSTQDAASILPDVCKSHKHQLVQMQERQQRIEALQNNFKKSKQEMSTNIHQRLGWVMHIETQISKLDSDLIFHIKTLRILECNLGALSQVKAAPQVYADMVVEAVRRRMFSRKFLQWADALSKDSSRMYKTEVEKRKKFARKLGDHFLVNTLFQGFGDSPPSFATDPPKPFDQNLPEVTVDDISFLQRAVPELVEIVSVPVETGSFPLSLLSKIMIDSSHIQVIAPHSHSSQKDLSDKPCVVVATEAPPTKFTLPEQQESTASAQYHPGISNLSNIARDVVTSSLKPFDDKTAKSSDNALESSGSAAVSDSNILEVATASHSAKTQTKTNSTNTDSTSPLSSTEFATADFYFEDSMPSPMADSPLDKKEDKKIDSSKSLSESVASLQVELAEKLLLIKELEMKLKETAKQSGQKDGSSDESTTLVGKSNTSDPALASDSCEVVSSDSSNNLALAPETNKEETTESHMAESETGSTCVAIMVSKEGTELPTSSLSNEDPIRIRKLEWELELANSDLTKFKESLFETETKLKEVQDQSEKALQEKSTIVQNLETEVEKIQIQLSGAKGVIQKRDETVHNLEKSLSSMKSRAEQLEQEVKGGNDSMERIKLRLLELWEKLKVDIPSFRQSLAELRDAVTGNKSNLDAVIASAITCIEKRVSLFNTSVLNDAYAEYSKEKEGLWAEIQQLKLDLHKSQLEFSEKQTHLNSRNEELASRMGQQEKKFALELNLQEEEYKKVLKDLETKYALEMELELDKCKAEVRENLEESERKWDSLNKLKEDLRVELESVKKIAAEEKEALLKAYEEKLEVLEKTLLADKDLISHLKQRFKSEMEEKMKERNQHASDLETTLAAVQTSLAAEKEHAISALKEQLTSQHEAVQGELKQQVEEQKANAAEMLEQKQLEHVHKLTELKTQFDVERESLMAEIKRHKPRERSSIEAQTDYDLLAWGLITSDTQTEIMGDAMTNSETQTGLELLADVISLTSSASYGSEEMIANRQQSTVTEDKDGKDMTDTLTKLQQTIDDLSTQLSCAHDKVSALESEVQKLHEEKADQRTESQMSESQQAVAGGGQSQYQEMMTSSNTGASFMVMEKESLSVETSPPDAELIRAKDKKIAQLEKKLMEMSLTSQEREVASDKVSIRGCDKGDLVLLCLDERHDQYVVFTVGTNLHFLHSESLEFLGLKTGGDASSRKSWILAEVVNKEYCLAKKPNNRFRVPQGTCFYRVKCKPWKSDIELSSPEKEIVKQVKIARAEHGVGARPKKLEKK